LNFLTRIPPRVGMIIFCAAALYFGARGPWRAVGSINSYDFASVYGATRSWLHGENPYDMRAVAREVHGAGDDPATLPYTDPPPSVYLPTALPIIASVAWLPWKAARLAWASLSIAAFAISVLLLFHRCTLDTAQRWLLGAFILLFSPTSSGLSTGNPSVISCGLTLGGVFLVLEQRTIVGAVLLGLAHSIKPQVSIAAVVVLALWGYWRALGLSFLIPAGAALVSFLRVFSFDQYRVWLLTLQRDIADASLPGGLNDPSPANYFSYHLINEAALLTVWLHNPLVVRALVWISVAVLACTYLLLRKNLCGDRRLRDLAFFCCLSLVSVYHRYYDAQLLLGTVPFLLVREKEARKVRAALWIGLLILLFPLQAIMAESLRHLNPASPGGLLLLRHQPVVLLLLCVLLIPWANRGGRPEQRSSNTANGQKLEEVAGPSGNTRSGHR
jgi:Glycosyltransferase family 87